MLPLLVAFRLVSPLVPCSSVKHLDERRALAYLTGVIAAVAQRKNIQPFLRDFLTPAERTAITQRLRVARLLLAGHSYRMIQGETGARFGTVSGVDRWLRKRSPNYHRLFPLRARRRAPRTGGFSDTFRLRPGSIKDLYQSLTGTALW